ncbi:MAG: hypothetical protein AABX11_01390 [Nanoarchaeota archaeon]
MNKKIVFNSVMALGFLVLAYFVNWLFVVPVAWLIWDNQREIMNGVNVNGKKK